MQKKDAEARNCLSYPFSCYILLQKEKVAIQLKKALYAFVSVKKADKIIEVCKNALCRLKQSVSKDYPKLLLTLNVREYFDEEERIETFKLIASRLLNK